jgi:hypothetical protein
MEETGKLMTLKQFRIARNGDPEGREVAPSKGEIGIKAKHGLNITGRFI